MKAKQRYQLFHLCVQRGLEPVRRHNTGIEMELRTPPGSFVCLLNFREFWILMTESLVVFFYGKGL
jgi:hypothetical protein